MLTIKIGDIFESKMDVLVNTVNCVGVMGKGIAQIYKQKYPLMFDEYKLLCSNKLIHTGELYPYYENNQMKIINFPTKEHWRSPSKIEYITTGLDWFIDNYELYGIKSIAFPPLGCGNGGLDWKTVGPLMYQKLNHLPIDIEIYAPYGTKKEELTIEFLKENSNEQMISGIKFGKINDNWLLVLKLVQCLEESNYSVKVGRTIFQKICYILTRYGTDLGLNFSKGTYGPYSADIKNMIQILSNNNLIQEKIEKNMILLTVTDSFSIEETKYSEKDKENVNNTYKLFRRIKDTPQAEMITTIIYSYDQLSKNGQQKITENQLCAYIMNWKKRYQTETNESKIRELSKNLTTMKLINLDYSHDFI